MMRSMFSGVSGLRVHQTKMDVISNNIANINTVGFKRSSTSFKESFNQTLSGATGAAEGKGGMNPQQIGMGANVGSVVTIMGQGAAQRTDYVSDLMIDGEGFFVVQDSTGYSFTRAGVFEVDPHGNLVDPNGYRVCGWKAQPDPDNPGKQKIVQESVAPINIYEGDNRYAPPSTTKNIEFSGNLNVDVSPQNNTFSFYDSVGNKYTVNATFTYTAGQGNAQGSWALSLPQNGTVGNTTVIEATVNGKDKVPMQITMDPVAPTFMFTDGILNQNPPNNTTVNLTNIQLLDEATGQPTNPNKYGSSFGGDVPTIGGGGVTQNAIAVDFSTLTQFNSKANVTSEMKDGNQAGTMEGYSIDGNGIIRGTYSNGTTKILNQISLAKFRNPSGLEKIGNNLYKETANSSEFDTVGSSASSLGSKIQSGALEMSNVDLSYEFSEMITAQRGFQANSRIITTSDEMIQELVNLKR